MATGTNKAFDRRYWIVSPNVNNDDTVDAWRRLSATKHVAFMGWGVDHRIGRRFVQEIKPNDVILIARRHKGRPDFVGFGIVEGASHRRASFHTPTKRYGSFRTLRAFQKTSPPARIPLIKALNHTMALVQLYPERSSSHRKLCDWMNMRLRHGKTINARKPSADRRQRRAHFTLLSLPTSGQLDYQVQTRAKTVRAQKIEARLVRDYENWLRGKGRDLERHQFEGGLICDAFERKRKHLIEAKSSSRREYIRMGVGQLLDYAHQVKPKRGRLKLALLLPRKPPPEAIEWLAPIKVKVIWRDGKQFRDNAGGRFI